MTESLVVIGGQQGVALPALFAQDARTAERVIEFFTACIRNPNTRKAYARATSQFATWCSVQGIVRCDPSMSRLMSRGCRNSSRLPRSRYNRGAAENLQCHLIFAAASP